MGSGGEYGGGAPSKAELLTTDTATGLWALPAGETLRGPGPGGSGAAPLPSPRSAPRAAGAPSIRGVACGDRDVLRDGTFPAHPPEPSPRVRAGMELPLCPPSPPCPVPAAPVPGPGPAHPMPAGSQLPPLGARPRSGPAPLPEPRVALRGRRERGRARLMIDPLFARALRAGPPRPVTRHRDPREGPGSIPADGAGAGRRALKELHFTEIRSCLNI